MINGGYDKKLYQSIETILIFHSSKNREVDWSLVRWQPGGYAHVDGKAICGII